MSLHMTMTTNVKAASRRCCIDIGVDTVTDAQMWSRRCAAAEPLNSRTVS